MFLLIIFASLIIPGFLMLVLNKKPLTATKSDQFTGRDRGKVLLIIGLLFGIVSSIINFSSYSNQVKDFESARSIHQKIVILEGRYAELCSTFTKHLAEEYPAIEKEIFSTISPTPSASSVPAPINIVLQYPELKSSKTLMKLVDETKLIADDMYSQQLAAQELYKEIRFRDNNPWIILKKKIPEDIYKSVRPE